MKKKIVSISIIFMLLISYASSVLAVTDRSNPSDGALKDIALSTSDDIYVDGDYNAKGLQVKPDKVEIYEYKESGMPTQKKQEDTNKGEYTQSNDKYCLTTHYSSGVGRQNLHYTFKLGEGAKTYNNVATIIYEDAIEYDGTKYDLKLNIKQISKTAGSACEVIFVKGRKTVEQADTGATQYDITTYDMSFYPTVGVEHANDSSVEVDADYIILDKNGNEKAVSGVIGFTDIDLSQGMFIKGITANSTNTFMDDKTIDTIKYNTNGNGTYIYSTINTDLTDGIQNNAYLLAKEKSKMEMAFYFGPTSSTTVGSGIRFRTGIVKTYHRIRTSVVKGTIDPNITDITDGQTKTINYRPNANTYLKSVTVDGNSVSTTTNANSYTFTNINEDHTIRVEYADKLKVIHDPKGGTPTPATQYLVPNEKATTVTQPTKTGYTFARWQKTGETTPYDYDTPVTEDTTLEAVWSPIKYTITYITNGGVNDPENPGEYTIEDTIDFKNPTRDGYDFKGWFEDEDLTQSKDGISHETGDKTVYAKWEAKKDTPYKVEHYKETDDGKYELVVTDELTGETDSTVTAEPKQYTGFEENKTHEDRVATGVVTSDGDLVLKLYYDKINYKVTFDPKGGTPDPDDQTVKYEDKAKEPSNPTRDGYTFQYWYYIDENNKEVKYNFDDPVTSDVDLIAKWEEAPAPAPTPEEQAQ